ncbi:unnamed protein product, partial [Adineta steineri]
YRAPEVILGYTEYTQAIDLWSVGCILAEMFGRKPIFSGINTIAQIQLIFIILGTPPKSYLQSLHSDCFRRLISSVGNRQPANFKALYPNATDDGIDLLRQLLVIDPEQRISANTALKHSFVNEFVIQLDDNDDFMMENDTEKFDSGFESEKWTLDQLQNAIHEEIAHFQIRPINRTADDDDDEELTSNIDKLHTHDQSMEIHQRVVIVDSTPPITSSATNLEIDTTRLVEKKRKHRRRKSGQHHHLHHHSHHHHSSKRLTSAMSVDEQATSGDTNDDDSIQLS